MGLLIVKGEAFDVPPPGAGLVTVTFIVAPVAKSAAGMLTVILVGVIESGVRGGLLPKVTVAPAAKLVPLMLRRKDVVLAVALAGASGAVIVGTALLLVKTKFAEVAPMALATTL